MGVRTAGRAARLAGERGFSGGRRAFLKMAAAGLALAALGPREARAFPQTYRQPSLPPAKRFAFAQLRYRGGNWDPEPSAPGQLLAELERLTTVEAFPERAALAPDAPELFSHPFLWMAGREDFEAFSTSELARLRAWLEAGGTLIADDCSGTPGYGFDAGFRRELSRCLPEGRLARLPSEHTVFKSFFLVRAVAGRQVASPFLEGMTVRERTAVILCSNDLFGAYARDPIGRWRNACTPGGERQRRLAFQLGVNLILYALCADYKQDRIHVPFLRQRS
jgi:hypothetical protein